MPRLEEESVSVPLARFDGGLNLRDQANQLAANETPDCMNVTPDADGGIFLRLGLDLVATLTGPNGPITNLFYSQTLGLMFAQVGTDLYSSSDLITWTSRKTFSTAAVVSLVDFHGKVIAGHPVDGIFSFNPVVATLTAAIHPSTVTAWKNSVWVGEGVRVSWSAIGDETSWPADNFVDVRASELSDEPITCLHPAQSLLVWKRRGFVAITNETTGAYRVLSGEAGAAGHMAVAEVDGEYVAINDNGIWRTNGTVPPVLVSGKVQPLFTPTQQNRATLSKWVATTYRDSRVLLSYAGGTSTVNTRTLDYDASAGWIVPCDFGVAAATHYGTQRLLYGAKPQTAGAGKVYELLKGGDDDGAQIDGRYVLPWLMPDNARASRLRHIAGVGRGDFRIYVRPDYQRILGDPYEVFSPPSNGGTWGTSKWGSFKWGSKPWQYDFDLWELGHGDTFQFEFRASQTASIIAPAPLGAQGVGEEAGSAGLYGLYPEFILLGDT